MKWNRGQIEIFLAILEETHRGNNKPTRIMYKANLGWAQLQKSLKKMSALGLIRTVPENNGYDGKSRVTYVNTEKGEEALEYFIKINLLVNSIER